MRKLELSRWWIITGYRYWQELEYLTSHDELLPLCHWPSMTDFPSFITAASFRARTRVTDRGESQATRDACTCDNRMPGKSVGQKLIGLLWSHFTITWDWQWLCDSSYMNEECKKVFLIPAGVYSRVASCTSNRGHLYFLVFFCDVFF